MIKIFHKEAVFNDDIEVNPCEEFKALAGGLNEMISLLSLVLSFHDRFKD